MHECGCDTNRDCLTPFDEAREALLAAAPVIQAGETVALSDALGRILARPVDAGLDVPPADNSAMDGYAIATSDAGDRGMVSLRVTQRIPAGTHGQPLAPGTAARIFTGAPMPVGADAVVMQEQCQREGDRILFDGPVTPGQHVRRAGEDIRAGSRILAPGVRLRAQELGLLASVGIPEVVVTRRLRVAILVTGDELVEPGGTLAAGQIYDSNRYTLGGLLRGLGCEVIDLGNVGDTLDATRRALRKAGREADLVISSGGVSVGEEDHVRAAMESLGQLALWRVAVKPGKPLAFGRLDDVPFIGLPGNPVSVFVTFALFVAPFIRRMQGQATVLPQSLPVIAGFDWPRPGSRREFLRVRLDPAEPDKMWARLYPNQGSGVLTSTSWADGLVDVMPGQVIRSGDRVDYLPFSTLLG